MKDPEVRRKMKRKHQEAMEKAKRLQSKKIKLSGNSQSISHQAIKSYQEAIMISDDEVQEDLSFVHDLGEDDQKTNRINEQSLVNERMGAKVLVAETLKEAIIISDDEEEVVDEISIVSFIEIKSCNRNREKYDKKVSFYRRGLKAKEDFTDTDHSCSKNMNRPRKNIENGLKGGPNKQISRYENSKLHRFYGSSGTKPSKVGSSQRRLGLITWSYLKFNFSHGQRR